MSDDEALALVRSFWQRVWNEGDLDAVDELVADPYIIHSQLGTDRMSSAAYKDRVTRYREVLHGGRSTIDDITVDGDKVWCRVTTRGVNVEPGDLTVVTWMTIHRVEGGRLAEAWVASITGVEWR